jgi:ribonuclease VapC
VSSCVLDASAALAVLREEPGASLVVSRKVGSLISAVNFAEVLGRMVQLGMEVDQAWRAAALVTREVIDFDHRQARIAAELLPHTRALGLGLGDRACLALAIHRKLPVLTADKAWKSLRVGVEIRVIR